METGSDPRELLAGALKELAALAGKPGAAPTRYHARAVLLGLGLVALTEGPEAAAGWVPRLRGVLASLGEGFGAAADEELRLAAAEHVRSVDPRFLDHPRYDLAYTVAARERLEARLAAAELLGIEVGEDLLERIAAADRLLEPYLAGPSGPGGGERSVPEGP